MATVAEGELWLEPRDGDLSLDAEELPKLPPFGSLKAPKLGGQLKSYPNAVILRRYARGEVICRQGEAGGTAFHILRRDELEQYREYLEAASQAATPERRRRLEAALADLIGVIRGWDEAVKSEPPRAADAPAGRVVAEVHLAVPVRDGSVSWVKKLIKGVLGGRAAVRGGRARARPSYIPIDGPRDLDYDSRTDVMYEGELFGEMSCLNRAPRSATVVAKCDCYLIEMLRLVFDQLLSDPAYKGDLDRKYRDRYLKLHLQTNPLMKALDDTLLDRVRSQAELVEVKPGELIYDEHDQGDGMLLVRNGIVRVVKSASFLFPPDDVTDPTALAAELCGAAGKNPETAGVSALLPEAVRTTLRASAAADAPATFLTARRDPSHALHPLWEHLPFAERDGAGPDADRFRKALAGFLAVALNEVVKGQALRDAPGMAEKAKQDRTGLKVWQIMAAPSRTSAAALRRCQRTLLDQVYGGKLGASPDDPDAADVRFRVGPESEWAGLAQALADAKALQDPLKQQVHARLSPAARDALARMLRVAAAAGGASAGPGKKIIGKAKPTTPAPEAAGETAPAADAPPPPSYDPKDALTVVEALNALIDEPTLLLLPAFPELIAKDKKFVALLRDYLPDNRAWVSYDTTQAARAFNRLLLEAALPGRFQPVLRRTDLSRTLSYISGREFLGEMALLLGVPRTATCVAYSHPIDDPKRPDAPVRLVRLPRALFDELRAKSPAFVREIERVAGQRTARERGTSTDRRTDDDAPRLDTPRAEDLGLVQGQALMLIDLERCTRCDECVKACVNAHEDGRSRLYLDGPRVGAYLVPSTCRSCLDPVCMVRCPVSSIQRGQLGEMIIEDWCIGCERCAQDCPYGSIQMHDVGVVSATDDRWEFAPAPASDNWLRRGARTAGWLRGPGPFRFDRELGEALAAHTRGGADSSRPLAFRLPFDVPGGRLSGRSKFLLTVKTPDPNVKVWLNGEPLLPAPAAEAHAGGGPEPLFEVEKKKTARGSNAVPYEIKLAARALRASGNVLGVRVTPGGTVTEPFLDVRLDEVPPGGDVKELHAVVCDLCHGLEGGPACVSNCPHEAAMRVHAPTRLLEGVRGG